MNAAGHRANGRAGFRPPALVLSASQPWAYVGAKPSTFTACRLLCPSLYPAAVPGGRQRHPSGQAIVTSGAGLLLARETNPSTEPEE